MAKFVIKDEAVGCIIEWTMTDRACDTIAGTHVFSAPLDCDTICDGEHTRLHDMIGS